MKLFLLVVVGGAIGSGARHLVNVGCALWLGNRFPWSTFLVNIVGSFMMGCIIAALVPYFGNSASVRAFLATGILGGFTTFSAFSLDAVQLFERGEIAAAVLYVAGSVILSILALMLGVGVIRLGLAR